METNQIKKKDYITAEELRILVPGMGIHTALELIKEIRKDMENQKLYVPKCKPYLALTRLVIEKLGL